MNSEYITQSSNYAQNAAQSYEESLSYLLDGLDEIKSLDQDAANIRYQNLLNTIRQQLPDIQEEFDMGTKAAYINKRQSEQEINADLSRLGVNTQGFGITQRNQNEIAYGQNYNALVINKNKAIRGVANQEVNALGQLSEDLANIDLEYAKNKLDTTQYIKDSTREVYNNEYNKAYSDLQYKDTLEQRELDNARADKQLENAEKQQAWENAFTQKQYADTLAQRKFENDLALKQYNLAAYNSRKTSITNPSSTGTTNPSSTGTDKTDSTIVNTNYCILLPSKNKIAQKEYNAMIEAIMDSGISVRNLFTYLSEMKKEKVFSSADVAAIKKQFGIK